MREIINWLFHRSERSYKLFSEYQTFSGKIFLRNNEIIDIENAKLHFRGNYIVFEALFTEPQIRYTRLTLNVDEIVYIKN